MTLGFCQDDAEIEMCKFLQNHSFDKYVGDKEIKRSIRKMRRRIYELQRAGLVIPSERSMIGQPHAMSMSHPGRRTVN